MAYYRDDEYSPTLADADYRTDDSDGDDQLVPVDDEDGDGVEDVDTGDDEEDNDEEL